MLRALQLNKGPCTLLLSLRQKHVGSGADDTIGSIVLAMVTRNSGHHPLLLFLRRQIGGVVTHTFRALFTRESINNVPSQEASIYHESNFCRLAFTLAARLVVQKRTRRECREHKNCSAYI